MDKDEFRELWFSKVDNATVEEVLASTFTGIPVPVLRYIKANQENWKASANATTIGELLAELQKEKT